MTAEPLPAWAFPPPGGFTADDLDRMPDLPPHTELIDASLVFVSPQKSFHSLAMYLLEKGLRASAPETLRVRREMTITLDSGNRPEPDISVVRAEATTADAHETGYKAVDTVLAVEVVSPESQLRDRKRKPQLYAEAGIQHFWLIEKDAGSRPVVHVYELDSVTGCYVPSGIHHERLKLTVPFDIDIDLTEIDRL